MTESQLRSKLVTTLRNQNAIVIPYIPSRYSSFGVADMTVVHKYFFGFIETKIVGNKKENNQAQIDQAVLCDNRGAHTAFVTFLDTEHYNLENSKLLIELFVRGKVLNFESTPRLLLRTLQTRIDKE